jgi:hypothetical protein
MSSNSADKVPQVVQGKNRFTRAVTTADGEFVLVPVQSEKIEKKKEQKDYSLPLLRGLTDKVTLARVAAKKLSLIEGDDAKLGFIEEVRRVFGKQPIRMKLHAFHEGMGVTPTTAAPQFSVQLNPFFTDGPIQGRTDRAIEEAALSQLFQQCFTHSMLVVVNLVPGNIPTVSSTVASPLYILSEGNTDVTQSTTLATAVLDGMVSGRKMWYVQAALGHSGGTTLAVSAVHGNPVLSLSIPNQFEYSGSSFGWVTTASSTTEKGKINFTGSATYSSDTLIIGQVYAEFDCSLRIRVGS